MTPQFSMRRLSVPPAGVVAFVGIALFVLMFAHSLAARSLWFDEAATYEFARMPWRQLWNAIHQGDAFYLFYYAAMHLWIAVAGMSEIALRLPSLAAAAVAVWGVWRLGTSLAGAAAGLVAAGLLAVNGYFGLFVSEARPYTLLVCASVVLSWLLVESVRTASERRWIAYGVAAVVGVYLHFFLGFVIVAHCVALAASGRRRDALRCVIAGVVATALAMPMLLIALHDANSQNGWLVKPTPRTFVDLFGTFSGTRMLWRIDLALAAIGAVQGLRGRRRDATILLLAWAVVPLLCVYTLGTIRPDFRPQYLMEMLAPYVMLSALGIIELRKAAYPAAACLVVAHLFALHHYVRPQAQDWRSIAPVVARDDAPIIVMPQRGYAPLAYYAPEAMRRVVYPSGFRIERSEFHEPLDHDLPHRLDPAARRVWVVYDSFTKGDPMNWRATPALRKALLRRYRPVLERDFSHLHVEEFVAR